MNMNFIFAWLFEFFLNAGLIAYIKLLQSLYIALPERIENIVLFIQLLVGFILILMACCIIVYTLYIAKIFTKTYNYLTFMHTYKFVLFLIAGCYYY